MTRIITRDRSYYRRLITLAIPVALQALVTFLVGFADNYMVNTLGDASLSGVYVGNSIQTLLQMFTDGIAVTVTIIGSQYWGKHDTLSIRKLIALGLRAAFIICAFFACFAIAIPKQIIAIFISDPTAIAEGATYLRWIAISYLFFGLSQVLICSMRVAEVTMIGFLSSFISLWVNVGLNYWFIFGGLGVPAMGVKGAAIATVCARATELLVVGIYVLKDKRISFRPADMKLRDGRMTRDFFRYGVPLMAGNVVWGVNTMCNTKIMGGYGTEVTAAVSVVNTINTMSYIFTSALANAIGLITGKTVGEGKFDLMKEYAKTTQVIFLALGIVMGGFLFLIDKPFIMLYKGISDAARAEAVSLAYVHAVSMIGTCYQMPVLFGLVKSGGDISFVFKNDTIFVFLVVLPSAFLSAHFGLPAWVTFACLKCDQILKCFVAVVKVNRYNWMKKLTRDNA